MFRFANMLYFHGRAILLIRNPFSAILSMFRHINFGFHSSSHIAFREDISSVFNTERVNLYFTEKFRKFAAKSIKKWKNIIKDWVILGNIIVVHHEDVINDKMEQMQRILDFLEVEPGKQRLACLELSNVDIFKRKSKALPSNPFAGELSKIIRQHIDQINSLLIEFGHPKIPFNKYKIF